MKTTKMTPCDQFAKAAIQSYMLVQEQAKSNDGFIPEDLHAKLAEYSYQIADEMIKQKYLRDTNLCDNCTSCFATCKSNPSFGLAIGFDNVVKCSNCHPKQKQIVSTFFRRIFYYCKNQIISFF